MSNVQASNESTHLSPPVTAGEMWLEVVVVPVTDVDRTKSFYEKLGWRLDADFPVEDGYRVVQVIDIDRARADLLERGVDISEPFHDATGTFHQAGETGRLSGPAPGRADYGSIAASSDPDGNGWLLQEIKTRLPGR
jgi:catechol 2,3-dioxygenase-like lactoylglutathione lyase family enzyme